MKWEWALHMRAQWRSTHPRNPEGPERGVTLSAILACPPRSFLKILCQRVGNFLVPECLDLGTSDILSELVTSTLITLMNLLVVQILKNRKIYKPLLFNKSNANLALFSRFYLIGTKSRGNKKLRSRAMF